MKLKFPIYANKPRVQPCKASVHDVRSSELQNIRRTAESYTTTVNLPSPRLSRRARRTEESNARDTNAVMNPIHARHCELSLIPTAVFREPYDCRSSQVVQQLRVDSWTTMRETRGSPFAQYEEVLAVKVAKQCLRSKSPSIAVVGNNDCDPQSCPRDVGVSAINPNSSHPTGSRARLDPRTGY